MLAQSVEHSPSGGPQYLDVIAFASSSEDEGFELQPEQDQVVSLGRRH